VRVCCGNELFTSDDKFDSGTGWLAGWLAKLHSVNQRKKNLEKQSDLSYGMHRAEVMWCSKCRAHLGYVFNDGPNPTGNKYSINSVALKLDNKR
jgi:peptide-methionine (R)-S-oxide reductase